MSGRCLNMSDWPGKRKRDEIKATRRVYLPRMSEDGGVAVQKSGRFYTVTPQGWRCLGELSSGGTEQTARVDSPGV